jgi:hypothetical protein
MEYTPPIGGAADASYVDANPAIGLEGSAVPAVTLEAPQREIVAVIEAGGMTPDAADNTQMAQSIAAQIVDALSGIDLSGYATLAALAAYAELDAPQTFTKAQRGAVVALASAAGHVASDFAAANNFSHTLTENTILDNPSNIVAGQSGQIVFTQAAAAKTLAFGSTWKFPGGTVPSVSTGSGAMDLLTYYVIDATHIAASLNKAVA